MCDVSIKQIINKWRKRLDLSSTGVTTKLVKKIIKYKGAQLLKNWRYINNNTKIKIKDKSTGIIWKQTWSQIQQGYWSDARGRKKLTTKFVRKEIEKRGGIVPENWDYKGAWYKFFIKCEKGHFFETCWGIIQQGSWCRKCGNIKRFRDVNTIKEIIKNKGGSFLDKHWCYEGIFKKFELYCSKGHLFETNSTNIIEGHWCPICATNVRSNNQRKNKKEIISLIETKGGILDDDFRYRDNSTKFWITCKNGHRWKTTWSSLYSMKSWCPYCSIFKTEQEFRKKIEKITGIRFPKKRPKWLIYPPTSRRLELDGYNKENKVAFEYQGYQHRELAHFDGYSTKGLLERQKRDVFKKQKCREKGVLLIQVPDYISKENWETGIKRKIDERLII